MPAGRPRNPEPRVPYVVPVDERIAAAIADEAFQSSLSSPKYVTDVITGYARGEHRIPRPKKGALARLGKGRKGKKAPTTKLRCSWLPDTLAWLGDMSARTGGFTSAGVVNYLLLDWFSVNPMGPILALEGDKAGVKTLAEITAVTTADTPRFTFTAHERFLDVVRGLADKADVTDQKYLRMVIASFADGEPLFKRPGKKAVSPLSPPKGDKELPTETLILYCHKEAQDWLHSLGQRCGGLNRSHVVLLLLLTWMRIDPFDGVLLGTD